MRAVGGPLLCISDLLSDVGEAVSGSPRDQPNTATVYGAATADVRPSDLPKLFQENFEELKAALNGTDHSWTALTLKLCAALETSDRLIECTDSHVSFISRKVEELEREIHRRDSAIATAKTIQNSLKH